MPRLYQVTPTDKIRAYLAGELETYRTIKEIAARTGLLGQQAGKVIRAEVRAGRAVRDLETGRRLWLVRGTAKQLARNEQMERALRLCQHKLAQYLASQKQLARLDEALYVATQALENWDENIVGLGDEGRLTAKELLNA